MIFLILLFVVIIILASNVRIVPQASAYVIERLGGYSTTWGVGLHFKIPFLDRVAKRVNLKEQVVDFPPQPVITKDNVTMQIDTVVFFQITDPKMYAYGVDNPIVAIEKLTATTLRNIIGDMELDQTLTSREVINTSMRSALDVATDPWGIKVNRVELKNIIPPEAIRNAMEKQMKAERERREAVTIAEGEKKSSILPFSRPRAPSRQRFWKLRLRSRQLSFVQKLRRRSVSRKQKVRQKQYVSFSRQMQKVSDT